MVLNGFNMLKHRWAQELIGSLGMEKLRWEKVAIDAAAQLFIEVMLQNVFSNV